MAFAVALLLAPMSALAADTPDFGLMLNSDGDPSIAEREPAASERALRERVKGLRGTVLLPTTGRLARKQPAPTAYAQWAVKDLRAFRQGWSDLAVAVSESSSTARMQVMEVQLSVSSNQ